LNSCGVFARISSYKEHRNIRKSTRTPFFIAARLVDVKSILTKNGNHSKELFKDGCVSFFLRGSMAEASAATTIDFPLPTFFVNIQLSDVGGHGGGKRRHYYTRYARHTRI